MNVPSRGTRPYDASKRRAAAAVRRQRVAEVAAELFVRDGWSATRLSDVAEAAEVSTELVAKAFGSKPGLLMAAMRAHSFGEQPNLQVAFAALRLEDEPDRHERLLRLAEFVLRTVPPAAQMLDVLTVAADQDPDLKRLLTTARVNHVGTCADACRLIALVPVTDEMVDELVLLTTLQTWLTLVHERGWTREHFSEWFTRRAGTLLGF